MAKLGNSDWQKEANELGFDIARTIGENGFSKIVISKDGKTATLSPVDVDGFFAGYRFAKSTHKS